MTPRALDPDIRSALIDAAARLLIEEGPAALTTRRLANEVGASTMAVYTYFKGMEELKRELRREGFARLAALQSQVPDTGDVVADVVGQGAAYFTNALANSHLYRFMFMEPLGEDEPEIGTETFETVVAAVARAVEAGRLEGDPERLATQFWASSHGVVSLCLAGVLTLEEAFMASRDMGVSLLIAFGEERDSAERIVDEAAAGFALPTGISS